MISLLISYLFTTYIQLVFQSAGQLTIQSVEHPISWLFDHLDIQIKLAIQSIDRLTI